MLCVYVGVEYEGYDLFLNNIFDDNWGDYVGVKFCGEFEIDFVVLNYGNLIVIYGMVCDCYWICGCVGCDFLGYVVGLEMILIGDCLVDE